MIAGGERDQFFPAETNHPTTGASWPTFLLQLISDLYIDKRIAKMASIETLPVTLSALPSGYSAPSKGKLSAVVDLPVYPAGPSFISAARRQILQRSFEEDDKHVLSAREAAAAQVEAAGDGNPYPGLGEEQESKETLASDPKEWKKQDHYAVLGLGHLRYKATDDHIRVARESYSCKLD